MSLTYTRPTDNVADDVTPTLATGTADANYPLANLTNSDPAVPFLTTDSIGINVVWDFGAAQRIDLVSIPMHGIPAATDVRIQGNATDSWGAPSLDSAVTIATYGADGFPLVAFEDLTGDTGYTASGYRFWRLSVPSHGGITKIGEIELWTTKRTLTRGFRFGVSPQRRRVTTVHTRQDGGRVVYDHGLVQRVIAGTVRHDATDLADLRALWSDALGPVLPFLIDATDTVGEAMLVWWPEPFDWARVELDTSEATIEWHELGRGLVL